MERTSGTVKTGFSSSFYSPDREGFRGVQADAQERAAEAYLNTVDEIAAAASVNVRPTTEQRCEECGWKTAYYWSAQVRGADEGQTAFFQCVRCQHVWSIK